MTSTLAPTARRRLTWAAAVTAVSLTLVTAGAQGAAADGPRTVTGGTLTWGVKASFRSYMTGFIANGTITPSAGATKDDANVITFTGGNGALSADGSTHFAYKGAARYYGHDGELDFTLSDPYLSVDKAGSGFLYMNYAVAGGPAKRVKMASVSGAAPVVSGDLASVANASTALTEDGVEVFSYKGHGFYPAGTALDPVSATADLAADKPSDPTPTPTTTTPTAEPTTPTSEPTTPTAEPTTPTTDPTPTADPTTPTEDPTTPTAEPTTPTTEPTTPTGDSTEPTSAPSQPATQVPGGPVTGPVVQTDLV